MDLSRSVALVTGGARRVGKAIVLELARAGCDVAVHYRRSSDEAHETADLVRQLGRRGIAVSSDLNDPTDWAPTVEKVAAEFGRLDILVNNASAFPLGSPDTVDEFDPAHWDRMMRTNLIAPMALVHHAKPHLEANGGGCVINLCDASSDRPWRNHLAYSTSKAGLACLTKALARALAPGIRVNGVAPGIAAFPQEYPPGLRERLIRRVPLGRGGSPEEVASLVRFLVESGDYLTGQIIPIDGGRNLT